MSQRSLWANARKQFQQELLSSAKGVNRYAQQIFINATSSYLDYVQMNEELLPYYTGNLHDSIATSVSLSGRILRANYMPKEAIRPQHGPGRKRIIGAQEAVQAVRRYRPNRSGLASTLFVAVPYAEGADAKSKHAGYFLWLREAFEHDMRAAAELLRRYPSGRVPSPSRRRFKG